MALVAKQAVEGRREALFARTFSLLTTQAPAGLVSKSIIEPCSIRNPLDTTPKHSANESGFRLKGSRSAAICFPVNVEDADKKSAHL